MVLAISFLVFAFFVVLVAGIWWVSQANRTVRDRLRQAGSHPAGVDILRVVDGKVAEKLCYVKG